MKLDRRQFLTVSTLAGVAGALAPSAKAFTLPDPPQKARLRLSCQEGVAPGKTLAEKLDFLEALGFEGLELGGRGLAKRVAGYPESPPGPQNQSQRDLCRLQRRAHLRTGGGPRKTAMDSMKEILTAAGALGSTGMIMVPAFHNQTKLGHQESRELLVKLLAELGDYAQKAGTRVLLEPLNRRECHFLRQVADAAAICRDVNNPGVALMGDFWHMTWEETSDMAAFIAAAKYLHHVHMASRKTRKMPGEDEGDNYVDGFKGLKLIGYQDFVSFECGCKGDRATSHSPPPRSCCASSGKRRWCKAPKPYFAITISIVSSRLCGASSSCVDRRARRSASPARPAYGRSPRRRPCGTSR